MRRHWVSAVGGLAAAGGLGVAYAAGVEVRNFVVRRTTVACLPSGHAPIKVLHISDLHLTPRQERKIAWIRSLAQLEPDLVVDTGDNIAHRDAVPVLINALGPLLDVPGVFVPGSNDYYEPSLRNPVKYLMTDDGRRHIDKPTLPWEQMFSVFSRRGWLNLTNEVGSLTVTGTRIGFVGLDDPHLFLEDLTTLQRADVDVDLRVGITHAPYLRVLDAFADEGFDITFAGHTHGGQLCLPFIGALVTNCDLDTGRAKGLHRHPADSAPLDENSTWLHVSAGAGTSPYAPVRFFCRPEATLVTLAPMDVGRLRTPVRDVVNL